MNSQGFKLLIWTVFIITLERVVVKMNNHIGLAMTALAFVLLVVHLLTSAKHYSFKNIDRNCQALLALLIMYSMSIVVRGLFDSQDSQMSFFGYLTSPLSITPYFLPFIALYDFNSKNFLTIVKVSSILAIIFTIYSIVSWKELLLLNSIGLDHYAGRGRYEYSYSIYTFYAELTSITAPFVLFILPDYISKKYWKLAVLNIAVAFIIGIIAGRRSSTFGLCLIFIAFYFLVYKNKTSGKIKMIIILILTMIALYSSGFLDFFISKIDSASREGVEINFYADMDMRSLIFGRGAMGSYYDPGFVYIDGIGKRTEIETGYLYLILKGGIIYLVIYVLLLLRASYLGLLKSNNTFTKAFASMCIISCIELIPFGLPMLNMKFITLWFGVGICLNKRIRSLTNNDIKLLYNL